MTPSDVDGLITALDDGTGEGPFAPWLGELLALAGEVAEALTPDRLPAGLRRRLYERAVEAAQTPRRGLAGLVRRPSLVGAAGGVAALAAAAVALAVLRGRDHRPGMPLPA